MPRSRVQPHRTDNDGYPNKKACAKLNVKYILDLRDFPGDPYEDKVCTVNEAFYETLPVTDGNRQSGNGILAGMYLLDKKGNEIGTHTEMEFAEKGEGIAEIRYGDVTFILAEKTVKITYKEDFIVENRMGKDKGHTGEKLSCTDVLLMLSYKGAEYAVKLLKGRFENNLMCSEDKEIEFELIG